MNFLLVSATTFEITPFIQKVSSVVFVPHQNTYSFAYQKHQIDVLITGVGMVSTALETGIALSKKKYDIVIQAGIAGAFNKQMELGEVFNITEDCFSELGAEDGDQFLSLNDMKLEGKTKFVNATVFHNKVLNEIPKINAITVNTVHGNEKNIEKTWAIFHPYAESMEGAAFMQACEKFNVSYIQLRSISNYVEKRNKEAWNIPLAITNLNTKLLDVINHF